MPSTTWTPADTSQAERYWAEYQRAHDVSSLLGQTAGIDPVTGKIWIGDSVQSVVDQRNAEQSDHPLYFVRIGSPTYYRKGGRR